jgi:hypothetical protein
LTAAISSSAWISLSQSSDSVLLLVVFELADRARRLLARAPRFFRGVVQLVRRTQAAQVFQARGLDQAELLDVVRIRRAIRFASGVGDGFALVVLGVRFFELFAEFVALGRRIAPHRALVLDGEALLAAFQHRRVTRQQAFVFAEIGDRRSGGGGGSGRIVGDGGHDGVPVTVPCWPDDTPRTAVGATAFRPDLSSF